MDIVQKYNSFNTNTPSSESSRKLIHIPKMVCDHKNITKLENQGVKPEGFLPIRQT
jgi:hypothetical protein